MNADALICSHPRSGGRWLRFLLGHYLTQRYGLDLDVTPETVFEVVPDHDPGSKRGYPAYRFGHRHDLPLVAVCHHPFATDLHRGMPILFLARNPYDITVSGYADLAREKGQYAGTFSSFIRDPRLGLPAWVGYVNRWAPRLLTHRDRVYVAYSQLNADPVQTLAAVLRFLNEEPEPDLVWAAVAHAADLRGARRIRTGQEGNFWDHMQPEQIFEIQEIVHRDLSGAGKHVLNAMGVSLDPFPRS
jgi:hypothetical protein